MVYRRLIYIAVPILFIGVIFFQFTEEKSLMIKGISFEAPKVEVRNETLFPIRQLGANWISIMPYAFTRNGSPDIQFNSHWQWRGEREEGVLETIKAAKANKLSVMMKPHLWIHNQFTGDVAFTTDDDWKRWESSYRDYVLYYAELSEREGVEIFCIGTELKTFVNRRPVFWIQLIRDIQKVYSGKLTYAANWDNFTNIPFWDRLDYIGVDAYFPICSQQTPTYDSLVKGWKPWIEKMEEVSNANDKNVIFTEIGYRSMDYCAKEPWVSYEDFGNENQEAQQNCIKAFFDVAHKASFIKGAFLWKWHTYEHLPEKGNKNYTFQQKAGEKIIQHYFNSVN